MIFKFPLDDQIVCFDDQSERLSVANPVGARILELHVAGLEHELICNTLFEEFDASRNLIEQDVRMFVQHWESGEVTQFKPLQTHVPDTQYVPYRPIQSVSDMVFHLPSGTFTVQSESAEVIDLLRPMFCLSEAVVQTPRHLTVQIFSEGENFPIVFEGHTLDTGESVEHAALVCLKGINVLVSHVESHALTLHAGAVVLGNSGVLLAARGGSGKTTLTAYLVACGYQLINDDAVHICAEPVNILPIPIAMCIKPGSWDIVAQWYPNLFQQKVFGSPDLEQRYLPPNDEQAARKHVPCKVVCFPHYRADASTRLTPIERPAALARIIESGCYLPKPIEAEHVERLVIWAQSLEFYSLEYSSVQEAESQIRTLLQQPGQ